jgi:hypothetical protein
MRPLRLVTRHTCRAENIMATPSNSQVLIMPDHLSAFHSGTDRQPWNKGKLIGAKPPLRTKATMIYKRTGNLRAVQILLGQTRIESSVRYVGVEIDPALAWLSRRINDFAARRLSH